MSRDRFYRPLQIAFAWPRWTYQRELLRLGLPMGLSYVVEVTSFTFMTLLVASLGTAVTGGHQIAANLAGLCYMVPLSLSVATSALVGQSIGAQDALGARRITRAGLRVTATVALVMCVSLWFARPTIVQLYTNDPAVTAVALSLLAFATVFHFFDAMQGIAGFILRAYKHAIAPMLVYTVSLWGIGLVGGWWIAFHPGDRRRTARREGPVGCRVREPRDGRDRAAPVDGASLATTAARVAMRWAVTRPRQTFQEMLAVVLQLGDRLVDVGQRLVLLMLLERRGDLGLPALAQFLQRADVEVAIVESTPRASASRAP